MQHDFHTTHWTAILGSRSELCEAYYNPVRNFIRRTVGDNHSQYGSRNAEDLTHDFFLRVLQGEEFHRLERGKGRFRSYLLGAVKFFLADVREKSAAIRRGGNEKVVALPDDVEEPSAELDLRFDRDWAETLVSQAVAQLRQEAVESGESERFDILRFQLSGNATEADRDLALQTLDVSREHFNVLVSRLRKKFREKIRNEIARTVENETEIAAELDYLIRVLRQPPSRLEG